MAVESDRQKIVELYGDPCSLVRIVNAAKTSTSNFPLCDNLCSNKGKPKCAVVVKGEKPVAGYCKFFSLLVKESSVEKFEKRLVSLIVKRNNEIEFVSQKFN